jgi:hypothetical protein
VVFFVISRKGFEDYLTVKDKLTAPLWISAGIISQAELESLRENGADVTDFNYVIGVNENEVIEGAIETIRSIIQTKLSGFRDSHWAKE